MEDPNRIVVEAEVHANQPEGNNTNPVATMEERNNELPPYYIDKADMMKKLRWAAHIRPDMKEFADILMRYREDSPFYDHLPFITDTRVASTKKLKTMAERFIDVLFDQVDSIQWDEASLEGNDSDIDLQYESPEEEEDDDNSTVSKILTRRQRRHSMKVSSERAFNTHGSDSSNEDEESIVRNQLSHSQSHFQTFNNTKTKEKPLADHNSSIGNNNQSFMLQQMEFMLKQQKEESERRERERTEENTRKRNEVLKKVQEERNNWSVNTIYKSNR